MNERLTYFYIKRVLLVGGLKEMVYCIQVVEFICVDSL